MIADLELALRRFSFNTLALNANLRKAFQ